ncbi:membrane protein [Bacteroidia bacterium]|nr:membrane protein [Bacteroidia bacterium]
MNRYHTILLIIIVVLTACNTTKYIPKGEYLLDQADIQMDDKGVDKSVLLPYIQQKPNSSKLGLGIYNLVRNDSGFIKKFIRKMGERPVLFNNHLVSVSVNELSVQMRNMGYLHSTVSAQVDTIHQKATVNYLIHNGEPYRIRNYTLDLPQLQIRRPATEPNRRTGSRRNDRNAQVQLDRRLIKEGSIFNLELLEKERARVSSLLSNRGYYAFAENNLHYLADTTLRSDQVDLRMILTDTTQQALSYTVKRVNVFSGYDPLEKEDYRIVDSVEYNGVHIYYDDLHFLRSKAIRNKVLVRPDQLYRERQGKSTYNAFQSLNSVGRVDIQYDSTDPDSTLLDCNIYLTPGNNHSLQAGFEGTNKAGDFGVALDATYGNLNIFNGSEIFNIHLRGAYEFVGGGSDKDALFHNYYELGVSPSLIFPQLHLPFVSSYMEDRFNAKTQYSLGYNIQRRPEYIRNFFNFSWKFNWSSRQSRLLHSLSLLDINYVFIPWMSDTFMDLFDDVNELTRMSYNDVFTAGINYNLIYTNAEVGRIRQNLYTIRFNTETSGNALYAISKATHATKWDTGAYVLFNNPFAQYVKGDISFAETFRLDANNSLAFRMGVGAAYPYLNSKILPFEKRYYGGGPNHVRGWKTRYLGPGSMEDEGNDPTRHIGDVNLILSAEYRYKLLSWLEPAFFVDAGNIWTIDDYTYQEGGRFHWNTFYREIAVGTGVGLRFDFNFLILRLDAGTQVYDPAVQHSVFFKGNFFKHSAVYVAIGYPF